MSGVPRPCLFPFAGSWICMIASFLLRRLCPVSQLVTQSALRQTAQGLKDQEQSHFITRTSRRTAYFILFTLLFSWNCRYSHFSSRPGDISEIDAGQFQVRLRLPTGTELNERRMPQSVILSSIEELAGKGNSLLRLLRRVAASNVCHQSHLFVTTSSRGRDKSKPSKDSGIDWRILKSACGCC